MVYYKEGVEGTMLEKNIQLSPKVCEAPSANALMFWELAAGSLLVADAVPS